MGVYTAFNPYALMKGATPYKMNLPDGLGACACDEASRPAPFGRANACTRSRKSPPWYRVFAAGVVLGLATLYGSGAFAALSRSIRTSLPVNARAD